MNTEARTAIASLTIRTPDTVRTLELLGVRIRFLVSSEDTAGAWSLMEYTAPARFAGPAPHVHARTLELFYVLDGELSLESAGQLQVLSAGSLAMVPVGTPHRFANPGEHPCRFLVHASPAGLERYFPALAGIVRESPSWPPADMRPVLELGQQFDTFSPE
jgi:mannose-6-phosphate isomerase-like protein (cupin superfamily)